MSRNDPFVPSMIEGRTMPRPVLQTEHWRAWTRAAHSIVVLWLERGRSRRVLASLDDYRLRDIGLSRADALVESAKPFWMP